MQLYGFCNPSKVVYSGVEHLRATDSEGTVHVALDMVQKKMTPIKQMSIPRLELCNALILAQLLHQVAKTLEVSLSNVFTWMDSRVTLGWLQGNPRRFMAFVGIGVWKSLKRSLWPAGGMSEEPTIQQIVSPGGCSLLN